MTLLLATDPTGQRIVDGLRQIRKEFTEAVLSPAGTWLTNVQPAGTVLLATSRFGSAAVARVAHDCANQQVPLLIVSLDPSELRVSPVFGPNHGECFQCHSASTDLDRYYDEHAMPAPDGYLPHHISLAVHMAVSRLDELAQAQAQATVPVSAGQTKVAHLIDNSLGTVSVPLDPCMHDQTPDIGRG